MHSAAAGLEGIRNRADIEELERAVKATGNSDLTEDMEEIKYLAEKVELLRDEGKASDADRLQKRVNKKVIYHFPMLLFLNHSTYFVNRSRLFITICRQQKGM